ncbi:transposase protein [Klebsiella pneumoniae]|uniref:Transposase protein n=1 Tax=Klebsiella pneumoniae TaxID=573 RepID=A0A378C4I9_KLEPN|nr:transposase protein [Klebsiella pneumoniae]
MTSLRPIWLTITAVLAKVPRHDFDVHRAVEHDEDLGLIFTVREKRKVSKSLTIQYDKMLYLIEDSELSRRAIGKYIDVYHYPDGRKELRLNGTLLPYSTYDRLSEIDQGAIVDNKRPWPNPGVYQSGAEQAG